MHVRRLGLALVVASLLAAGLAAADGPRQPAGPGGCITQDGTDGCARGRALLGVAGIAMSGDGRNLYAMAQGSRAVATLVRAPRSGSLRQPAGTAGCVSELPETGCAPGRNLEVARAGTISRDGRFLYVVTEGGLAIFARGRGGALRQLRGSRGCLREDGELGCAGARAVRGGRAVALSPDGRTLYAGGLSNAVSVFRRNRASGALTQLAGARGCVAETGLDSAGCGPGRGLVAPRSLYVSRDGRRVYVGSLGFEARPAALAVFGRGRRGALTQLRGPRGCLTAAGDDDCGRVRGLLGVHDIVPRPGTRELYVVGSTDVEDGGVAVLRHGRDGHLRQPGGRRGCFTPAGSSGCAPARALHGAHTLAFRDDGRVAYVTSEVAAGSVAVLRGRRRLRQPGGGAGCLNGDGAEGCRPVRALRGAHWALLSPDERFVYVAALFGHGVVVLQNGER